MLWKSLKIERKKKRSRAIRDKKSCCSLPYSFHACEKDMAEEKKRNKMVVSHYQPVIAYLLEDDEIEKNDLIRDVSTGYRSPLENGS